MITQSSHPFGEAIRPYSYWPSFPSGSYLSRGGLSLKTVFTIVTPPVSELTVGVVFVVTCVTVGVVFVVTCVTVGAVFVVTCVTVGAVFVVTCVTVGAVFVVTCVTVGVVVVVACVPVPLLGCCALLIMHSGHNQNLLLFGILFLPRHDKWKNFPLVQFMFVHLTSLSFLSATVLQVQIEFIFRASLIMLADCCLEAPLLNCGKVLHLGQYQVLGIASILKHDK